MTDNPTSTEAAQAAESAINQALQAAKDTKDHTSDAALLALLAALIAPLGAAETAAIAAVAAPGVEAAAAVAAAMASAEAASLALETATSTTTETECQPAKRLRYRARPSPKPAKFCFTLKYQGPVNAPSNANEIPQKANCKNSASFTLPSFLLRTLPSELSSTEEFFVKLIRATEHGIVYQYSDKAILQAVEQGAKYRLGNQRATTNGYPRKFSNTAGVDNVISNDACPKDQLLEFPILNSGQLLSGGGSMKFDVGTERVLFTVDSNGNTQFCGIMTHDSPNKVPNPATGSLLDPYTNCVPVT